MNDLIFKHVTKVFGGNVNALNDFTLTVQKGELMVLLGPSGCGKTTLLRMVAGLEKPSGGEILFNNQSIRNVPPPQRPFALVFQNYALYPHLSVEKNLIYHLQVQKTARPEIERRLEETIELLRLGRGELKRKPAELSGGQRQRVALGKAIMRKPCVFLLDEPLSNLDQKLRLHLRSELKRIQRALKATMLLVTHDQNEAMAMGDRIAILNQGRVEQVGRPQDLYQHPENSFIASFLANPPMNLIAGTLENKNGAWVFREANGGSITIHLNRLPAGFPETCCNREIVLGIRPEAVTTTARLSGSLCQCHARAVDVEFAGPVVYLHLDSGAHRISSLSGRDADASVGQLLALRIDTEALFFFDPVSGRRISVNL